MASTACFYSRLPSQLAWGAFWRSARWGHELECVLTDSRAPRSDQEIIVVTRSSGWKSSNPSRHMTAWMEGKRSRELSGDSNESRGSVRVAEWFIGFAAAPESVHQYGEFSSRGDDGFLLS